jgi:hypothetical protein
VNNVARFSVCLVVLVLAGVAHGLLTHRWQPAADFAAIQARLDQVPYAIGPWVGRDAPVDPEVLDQVAIRAYLAREYRDARSGRAVRALLVAGPPGPIVVHTPDLCYQRSGFEQAGAAERRTIEQPRAQFWAATFAAGPPVPSQLLIWWGWNGGSGWESPDHTRARVQYAFRPVLYKLYLVTDGLTKKPGQAGEFDEFAALLLPELDKVVADQP